MWHFIHYKSKETNYNFPETLSNVLSAGKNKYLDWIKEVLTTILAGGCMPISRDYCVYAAGVLGLLLYLTNLSHWSRLQLWLFAQAASKISHISATRCGKCLVWKPGLSAPEIETLNICFIHLKVTEAEVKIPQLRPQCAGCGIMSNSVMGASITTVSPNLPNMLTSFR